MSGPPMLGDKARGAPASRAPVNRAPVSRAPVRRAPVSLDLSSSSRCQMATVEPTDRKSLEFAEAKLAASFADLEACRA